MSKHTQKFELTQLIKAEPAQVFYAFINATALKEWFCNIATVRPKPGGRVYFAWDSGYYTCGEYLALEADHSLTFSWQGRNEPGPTQVEINLERTDQGTRLLLAHTGIGNGTEWDRVSQEISKGWSSSLENLASVLETGADQRIVLRPMLGIFPSDLDAEAAARHGIPVNEGLILDDVVEGMGAASAGLQKHDVIVSMAGKAIADYQSLSNAIQHQRAGNIVEVVFYRGSEKLTRQLELSRRPIPDIPATVLDLAQAAKLRYEKIEAEVEQFFNGVTDDEASYKINPGEWSVKEVLIHLILGERDNQSYITNLLGGQEQWSDDFVGNIQVPINAILSVYRGLPELLSELKRSYAITTALYANIPSDFPTVRRASFWRIAYYLLQDSIHERGHFEQMQAAIQAARASQQS